jgi:hypothetical protein
MAVANDTVRERRTTSKRGRPPQSKIARQFRLINTSANHWCAQRAYTYVHCWRRGDGKRISYQDAVDLAVTKCKIEALKASLRDGEARRHPNPRQVMDILRRGRTAFRLDPEWEELGPPRLKW